MSLATRPQFSSSRLEGGSAARGQGRRVTPPRARAAPAAPVLDEPGDPPAVLVVEAGGRLVGEEDGRPVDHRAGERNPLRLAVGERGGVGAGVFGYAELFQHLPASGGVRRQAGEVAGQSDVVQYTQGVE